MNLIKPGKARSKVVAREFPKNYENDYKKKFSASFHENLFFQKGQIDTSKMKVPKNGEKSTQVYDDVIFHLI